MLRQEFYDYKNKPKPKNTAPKVFVAMGGADHSNINIEILRVVGEVGDIEVNLVTTTANKNLEQLIEYCKHKRWVNLYINSTEIARLMHESDFAIVTPSVTVNEVCFMGMPLISIKTAKNQSDIFEYLKKKHYEVVDGFDRKQLIKYIQYHKQNCIVGFELHNFVELDHKDILKVLSWRNNPIIRNNMYNTEEIKLDDHLNFIKYLSNCEDKEYFVVKKDKQDVGVVDFTQIIPFDSLHMGLYAKPGVRGAGNILMKAIVTYSFKILGVSKIYAEVFEFNNRAYNLYLKYGFDNIGSKEINNRKVICMVLKR